MLGSGMASVTVELASANESTKKYQSGHHIRPRTVIINFENRIIKFDITVNKALPVGAIDAMS